MVSFAKNVCILLESVEIVVMELRFCKVVCYIDIFFKQIVWGEEKQKGVQSRVGRSWNSFVRNTRKTWLDPCCSHKHFYFYFFTELSVCGQGKHPCLSFFVKRRKCTESSLGYPVLWFSEVEVVTVNCRFIANHKVGSKWFASSDGSRKSRSKHCGTLLGGRPGRCYWCFRDGHSKLISWKEILQIYFFIF